MLTDAPKAEQSQKKPRLSLLRGQNSPLAPPPHKHSRRSSPAGRGTRKENPFGVQNGRFVSFGRNVSRAGCGSRHAAQKGETSERNKTPFCIISLEVLPPQERTRRNLSGQRSPARRHSPRTPLRFGSAPLRAVRRVAAARLPVAGLAG